MAKQKQSSIIKRVEYDPGTRDLTITFTTGSKYIYRDVPQAVVRRFTTAESQGMFFHTHIRNKFETEKVDEEEGQ